MTKEQFINLLNKKLQVIAEDERKDIIDEYVNHIEMKVQEGKTEEEAIEDFGDIDELVKDILEAYKINTDNVNRDSFDEKVNSFLDNMFEYFKKFVGSFTSLDVDDVVKLIFEILVILLVLIILRIPFSILSSLGSSLLHSLLGFGIGSFLGWIWKFIIGVAYLIVFVVVLVNVLTKRLQRYRNHEQHASGVMDDIKDSLHFDRNNFTSPRRDEETIYKEDESKEETNGQNDQKYKYQYTSSSYQRPIHEDLGKGVGSIASVIAKIFCMLLMLPFIGIAIALCVILGIMVSLSVQGVTFIGAYFIVIGACIGIFSFISLVFRTVFKGGRC